MNPTPRLLAAALTALALLAPAADAATTQAGRTILHVPEPTGSSTAPLDEWLIDAASRLPTPAGHVHVAPDTSGPAEVRYADPRTIHWYPAATMGLAERVTWLHEIGHVFDLTLRPRASRYLRNRFVRIYYPSPLWDRWPRGEPLWSVYIEDFGDAYARCAIGDHAPAYNPGYGSTPSLQQHHRVCRVIRRAAAFDTKERNR